MMKIICSWCEKEGLPSTLGEREPLDDPSESHGICAMHQRQILQEVRSRFERRVSTLMVVRPGDQATFDYLVNRARTIPGIEVIFDRRRSDRRLGERRREPRSSVHDRRMGDRRVLCGRRLAGGCLLVQLGPHETTVLSDTDLDDDLPRTAPSASTSAPVLAPPAAAAAPDECAAALRRWMTHSESVLPKVLAAVKRAETAAKAVETLGAELASTRRLLDDMRRDKAGLVTDLLDRIHDLERVTADIATALRQARRP